jgi:hypothetical protein
LVHFQKLRFGGVWAFERDNYWRKSVVPEVIACVDASLFLPKNSVEKASFSGMHKVQFTPSRTTFQWIWQANNQSNYASGNFCLKMRGGGGRQGSPDSGALFQLLATG